MKAALLLLVLNPATGTALPQPCGTTISCPHPISVRGKSGDDAVLELLSAMQKAVDAQKAYHAAITAEAKTRAELNASLEYWLQDKYEETATAVGTRKKDMEDRFDELNTLMQEAYGTRPTKSGGNVKGGPADGAQARWAPKIVPRRPDGRILYTAKAGSNGKVVGVDFSRGRALNASGTTLANGDVLIPIREVEEALRKRDPRWLGSTYYHESVHMAQLIDKGWTSIEQGEVDAYDTVLKSADKFGLDDVQKTRISANAQTNENRVNAGRTSSAYPDDTDLQTARIWHEETEAEEQAIRDAQQELRVDLYRERKMREAEARQRAASARLPRNGGPSSAPGEATALDAQRLRGVANACFLEPSDPQRSLYRVRTWERPDIRLDPSAANASATRVSLMFLGACLNSDAANPCVDAMPDFRALRPRQDFFDLTRRAMTTYLWPQECVDDLAKSTRPGDDYGKIRKRAAKAREEALRANVPSNKPPQTPNPPREPREPRERPAPPPRSGSGNCYWSNDGREVCVP